MASKKTKFNVGLFVIIGLAMAITAIIWVGASNYFSQGRKFVVYFDESVQGLDIDSAVKFRGVSIGRVDGISLAPDSAMIEVVIAVEKDMDLEDNMVAQLTSVGITGLMFIEIDRKEEGEKIRDLEISFEPPYPVIQSKPSGMKMFMDGMTDLRNLILKFDTETISEKLKIGVHNLNRTLDNANETVVMINGIISENKNELDDVFSSLKRSIVNADIFLQEGVGILKRSNANLTGIQNHLMVTMQNLERASENLNAFIDLISDQPSQLMFGEPPPSRKMLDKRK